MQVFTNTNCCNSTNHFSQTKKQANPLAFFSEIRSAFSCLRAGLQKGITAVFFAALIIMSGAATAQSTANYTFATGVTGSLAADLNSNAVDLTTGSTSVVAAGLDDTQSALASIGFDFWFMGTRYTQFSASDNGVIGLGAQPGNTTYALPNSTIPTIAPFANDMRVGTNGIVRSKVVGTAPNRCLVIEWSNNMIRFATAAAGTATFQTRLYETTGVIEFMYGSMTTNAATPNPYYVGFSTNTTANNVVTVNTTANTVTTSATVNSNTYTASSTITQLNSASNGSRRFYKFTPISVVSPTALTFSSVTSSGMTLNWADNSSNELGFAIYQSSDGGTTYTFNSSVAANVVSKAITGLAAGTYFWKVYAIRESLSSSAASGSQATLATYTSIVSGGDWNTAATWSVSTGGNAVPVAGAVVIVNTNVTAAATPANQVGSITVNSGFTLTLNGAYINPGGSSITVNSGGTLALGASLTNSGTTTINGNAQINGGGFASGNSFVYAAAGTTLTMNHNSGLYGISSGQAFWPTANPPFNVTIQGTGAQINNTVGNVAGTLTVNSQLACAAAASVTVTGTAIIAAQLANNASGGFVANGNFQINGGGFVTSNAISYGAASTLIYNTSSYTTNTTEFPASGVKNVTITAPSGTNTVTLDGDKTITGTLAVGAHILNGGKSMSAATITIGAGSMVMGTLTTSTAFTCSGASSVSLSGSWNVTGFTKSTSTVNFTNTGNYNVSTNFYNLTNSGGTRSLTQNLNVENILLVSGGQMGVTGGTARLLTMSGAAAVININGGAIYGTDAGSSNDLSLLVSGTQTTITGSATATNDDEKKFISITVNSAKTLILQTGILCKYGTFTVNGTLQIDPNGFVENSPTYGTNAKSPIYGAAALLKYNNNAVFSRGAEWTTTAGTIGITAGYPNDITVTNNTTLDVPATGTGAFSTAMGLAGTLTIDAGSSLFMDYGGSNKSGSLAVGKNLVLSGNLSLGNAVGGDMTIGGNWTRTGTFTPNSRLVTFVNGGSAQTLTGVTTFDYLTLNNSLGLTLAGNVIVNQTLGISAGKITLGANTLTVAGAITPASSSTYVVTNGAGVLKRLAVGNTATLFPIGINTTNYTPVTVTNTTGTSDISAGLVSPPTNAVSNSSKIVNLQWSITSSAATTATITPVWVATNQGITFTNTGAGEMGNYISGYTIYPVTLNTTNTTATGVALQSGSNAIVVGNTGAVQTPPPANDQCSGALAIPASGPFPYLTAAVDITNATNTGDPANTCQSNFNKGIWYSFTPAATGTYLFSTCSSETATTISDDVMTIYTGTCGAQTQLACNDDAGPSCSGLLASISQALTAGTTYYILVGGYDVNVGNIQIKVTAVPGFSATALTAFGAQCINNTYGPNSFTINGIGLTSAPVTVAALNGYTYSTDNITYTPSLSIAQPGGNFTKLINVKFTPTAVQSYSGNIVVGGGGVTPINVAAGGSGVNTAPTVTGGPASAITSTAATVAGNITVTGCTAISAYGIEYSTTNGFANGAGTTAAASNLSSGAFSSGLSNLLPATIYYYHAYATNGAGTAYSAQGSFTTASLAAPVAEPATGNTTNSFVANWDAVNGATGYLLDVSTDINFPTASATLVTWNFPNNPDNATADGGIAANASRTISTVGAAGTLAFNVTGASTAAATNSNWVSGNGVDWWQVDLTSTGYTGLTLSSKLRGSNTGPRDFKVQYRVGTGGAWTDVPGATITTANNFTAGVLTNVSLPATCDNQSQIFLRWIMTSNTSVNGGTVASAGTSTMDDIVVNGNILSSAVPGYNGLAVAGISSAVTGLAANTSYFYRVRATSTTDVSPNSNIITAQTCQNVTLGTLASSYCSNAAAVTLTGTPAGGSFSGPGVSGSTFTPSAANTGANLITYTYTNGNCTGSASQSVNVTAAPLVSFSGLNTDYCLNDGAVPLTGTPSGGSFSGAGITGSSFSPASAGTGTFTITYSYTDGANCSNSSSQQVTVHALPALTIAQQTNVSCPGGNDGTATVSASGPASEFTYSWNTDPVQTTATATGLSAGTYMVTVTGNFGCRSTISVTIGTTPDNTPPTISCAPDQSQSNDFGDCGANVTVAPPITGDNCGVASVTNDYTHTSDASGHYPVGTTQVVWTVTDNSGHTATCTQAITVTDDQAPTIRCAPDQTQTNDAGDCGAMVTVVGPTPKDNCGIASLTNDYTHTSNASGHYPVGTTTVIWTVTDNSGHTATCTQTITVTDDEAPTIHCARDQSQTNDLGDCGANVTVTAPGTQDNCGVRSVTNDYTNSSDASGHYPVGTTSVIWTVTDNSGHTATCTQAITVTDDEAPTITCPADQTLNNGRFDCGANVSMRAPVTHDNCGVASVTNDFNNTDNASGHYPVGTTHVVWTVTDNSGHTATCTQTITINDAEAPSIACSQDQTQSNDPGDCGADVIVRTPSTRDNCGVASVTNDYTNSSSANGHYPVGVTHVVWTVTDVNGNTAQCTQTITVTDDEAPTIHCAPDQTQTNDAGDCGANVTVVGPATHDNCGVRSVTNDFNNTADASGHYRVGTTNVIWTVTDNSGHTSQCTQTITVTDDEAPTIHCAADQTQTNDLGDCGANVTVVAPVTHDNCGVRSVTNDYTNTSDASGHYPVGTTSVIWTVTDNSGHTATCTQTITVTDDEAPTIHCAPDQTQTNDLGDCGANVTVVAPATHDNCGVRAVTNDYTNTSDASGHYPVGTTSVIWTVTDNSGHTATCTQTITVTDDEAPTIHCAPDQTQTNDAGDCGANVTVTAPATHDNCGVRSVTNDYTNTSDASGHYPVGTTNVIWTVTDNSGHTATCTQTIAVTDDEAPTIHCAPDQTQTNDAGDCGANVTVVAPATHDNCGVRSVINDYTNTSDASGHYPVGTTSVIWTVTDNSGHTATCTQTITVTDDEAPTIHCAPDQTQTNDAGDCGANVTVISPMTHDNCGVASVTNDYTNTSDASGHYPVGTTSVIWTVTDNSGHTATCTQTITVTDDEAPTIHCAPDQTQTNDLGDCGANVTVTAPATHDNCGVRSVTNDFNNTADASGHYPVGTTNVIWTVTDNSGHTATCTQIITVTDDEAPTIHCAPDQTQTNDLGDCGANVTVTAPATHDNCGVRAVTNDYTNTSDASGHYPVGTTNVIWTVTDNSGHTATCTQTITVTDDEAPTIHCAPDQTQTNDAGDCGANVTVISPMTHDNCGVASVTNDYTNTSDASGHYPVGTTSVIWTVTDNSGHTATCTQTITVTDDEAPTIHCAPDQTQTNDAGDCGANVTVISPMTHDNCGVASVTNDYTNTSDASGHYPVGTTSVIWTVTDNSGHTATCTQTITVTDDEAPTIHCAPDQTQTNDAGDCGANVTVTAPGTHDNCGVRSVTNDFNNTADASGHYPVGTTNVIWTVTDNSGHTATCTQTITVTDDEAPTIHCAPDQTQTNDLGDCGANVTVTAPGTHDNCGVRSVTNDYTNTSDASGHYPVGTTNLIWTVTDNSGHTATCTQTITVTDDEAPTIHCAPDQTQTNDAGDCGANVTVMAPATHDNCGVRSVTNDYTNTSDASGHYPVGTTNVIWTVTDNSGHTATCTQTITVTDDQAPTIHCAPDQTQTNDAGDCGAMVTVVGPTPKDNCGIASVTNDYTHTSNASGHYPVGTTTVIWTVTDNSGHMTSCTQTITVTDDESPVLIGVPGNVSVECDAVPTAPTVTASDNCPGYSAVSYNETRTNGTCPNNYTLTRTWTVTDAHGHMTTGSQTIMVADHTAPVISTTTGSLDRSMECSDDQALALALGLAPAATDNCGSVHINVVSDITTAGSCAHAYTRVRTWNFTDDCTNTSGNFTQTITVSDHTAPALTGAAYAGTSGTNACMSAAATAAPFDAANAAQGYTDNCGGTVTATRTNTGVTGTNCAWTVTYTFDVTDACGNTLHNQTYHNTGGDQTPPVISCPPAPAPVQCGMAIPAPYSSVSAFVNAGGSVSDNCSTANTTISSSDVENGDPSTNHYSITRTYTIKDACGYAATCTQTITINDQTAPVIACPSPISANNTTGLCSAVVCYPLPSVSDNCRPATPAGYTFKANFGNSYFYQANTLTNFTTAKANATAAGGHLAMIKSAAENAALVSGGAGFAWLDGSDAGHEGTFIYSDCSTATYHPFCAGEPNGGTGENNLEFESGGCWNDLVASAARYGLLEIEGARLMQTAGLPSGSAFPVGVTTNTFVATDAAGITSTCSFTVTVNDVEKPTIVCPADQTKTNDPGDCGANISVAAPVTHDNCGIRSVINDYNNTSNASGHYPVGTTTVTWTVTDNSGNTATCTQMITVTDDESPRITCGAAINHTADAGVCSYSFTPATPGATDNCPGVTVTGVRNDNQALNAPYPVGTTIITWTASDTHGHTASCTQNVVVTDNEKPKLIAVPANRTAECSAVPAAATVTATDNCPGVGNVMYTETRTNGDCPNRYTLTRTWTVTDAHGNTTTATQVITVVDTTPPTFTRPADVTIGFTSTCGYDASLANTGDVVDETDNCSTGLNATYADTTTQCGSNTVIKRTWHLADLCGNAAADQVQTITVSDNNTTYIIYAIDEVHFGENNFIAGDVGVTAANGKAEFKKNDVLDPYFVRAKNITTQAPSAVNNKVLSPATGGPNPTFYPFMGDTHGLTDYTVSVSTAVPIATNYKNLTIKKGVSCTVTGTLYSHITQEEGSVVTYAPSGGVLNVEEFNAKGNKNSPVTQQIFSTCTSMRIANHVDLGDNDWFNVNGPKVIVYCGDNNKDGEDFHVHGKNSMVTANIYIPIGDLHVDGSDDNSTTVMTGWFITQKLHSDGKNVTWNRYTCTASRNFAANKTPVTDDAPAIVATPAQTAFDVNAYPNPTRTDFTLEIKGFDQSKPVLVRITDISGRVVFSKTAVVSKGSVIKAGEGLRPGTYFAEISQGTAHKVIKLLKLD